MQDVLSRQMTALTHNDTPQALQGVRPALTLDRPLIAVFGHVGAGHAHSMGGIVQDDSAGFVTAVALLRAALSVDLRVASVEVDPATGRIRVTTRAGGVGETVPRRGVTPQEARLLQAAVGLDASFCHTVTCYALGRIYGQGIAECAVCFEAALAFAVIDSFKHCHPEAVLLQDILHGNNQDRLLGATITLSGQPVCVVAVANYTEGGLGPNEDAEGNVLLANPETFATRLGLDEIPNIVLECKAFNPPLCRDLSSRRMLTRLNDAVDNTVVGQALLDGAARTGIPMCHDFQSYPRDTRLKQNTLHFGAALEALAQEFSRVESAADKVNLLASLTRLASEDAGAITPMSHAVNAHFGNGGLTPGTGAVLSMLVPEAECRAWGVPVLFQEDLELYLQTIVAGIDVLKDRLPEARQELQQKRLPFSWNS